jgi:phage gpG-like protein
MGWKRNTAAMSIFNKKMEKEINQRLENAAAYAETAVKMELSRPGSGKLYGSHRASAPGQPPAVLTGDLRASITHKVVRAGMFLTAMVGSNKYTAPLLEFGTSKMAPRPFMRVTIERIQPILWKLMAGGKS